MGIEIQRLSTYLKISFQFVKFKQRNIRPWQQQQQQQQKQEKVEVILRTFLRDSLSCPQKMHFSASFAEVGSIDTTHIIILID